MIASIGLTTGELYRFQVSENVEYFRRKSGIQICSQKKPRPAARLQMFPLIAGVTQSTIQIVETTKCQHPTLSDAESSLYVPDKICKVFMHALGAKY